MFGYVIILNIGKSNHGYSVRSIGPSNSTVSTHLECTVASLEGMVMAEENKGPVINAKASTKAYFEAYMEGHPHVKRQDAVKAAWRYFGRFNDTPVSREAREWFEANVGKVEF